MKKYYLIVCLLSFLLSICGGADYTYVDTNEQKVGSGLFSGEDGVFTVVKKGSDTIQNEDDSKDTSDSE